MSASMNQVILVGNLGRDPEMRSTAGGTSVANLNLATTETFNGEKKTEWHRVICYGKNADNAGKYLHKGSACLIEGKLSTRSWEKDGKTHYATEVIANRIQFLDKPKQEGVYEPKTGQPKWIPPVETPTLMQTAVMDESDIPF